jgi:hypothetical protein
MNPEGTWTPRAWRLLNPKLLVIILPNVPSTPLGAVPLHAYNRAAHSIDGIKEYFVDVGPFDVMISNNGVVDPDTFEGDVTVINERGKRVGQWLGTGPHTDT